MPRNLVKVVAVFALSACLMMGPAARAQQQGQSDPQGEGPQSRALFLAALAPLLGNVMSSLSDSLFDWLGLKPSATANGAPAAAPGAAPNAPLSPGLAYEVYSMGTGGDPLRVDPAGHTFRTGEMFYVRYVPNVPGMVEAVNVNAAGKTFTLGSWTVQAGQEIRLPAAGAFQFQGQTGQEQLRLTLTPCASGAAGRDIVIAAGGAQAGAMLGQCGQQAPRTRDIVVNVQGTTAYGVAAVGDDERGRGRYDARAVTITLRHAAPTGTASAAGRGWLVTPEEASQPRSRALVVKKSDPGGPKVVVQAPGAVKVVKPPVNIHVAFEPQAGADVDMKTLQVTYVAMFDVDITDRLTPYVTPSGIHADAAELPSGDHTIEISVKDTQGRKSVERLSFEVQD